MPPTLASSSTPRPRTSDAHKRRLEVFVEVPPSPVLSAGATPQQATSKPEPTSATPKQSTSSRATSSSLKRKLEVFVDIPPSPLHRTTPKTFSFQNHKNRAYVSIPASPLAISRTKGTLNKGIRASPLSTKAFNLNTSTGPPNKKTKLTDLVKPQSKMSNETSENDPYPNGWFNCHQCRKKQDNTLGVQCTISFQRRCTTTYCKTCLRKRYGLNADTIKLREAIPDARHASGVSYRWTCPKCADSCNCNRCRKSKGLPALGKIPVPEQPTKLCTPARPGAKSAFQIFRPPGGSAPSIGSGNPRQELSKPRPPRAKKPIPEPKWVSIPIELNRSEVEDRFLVREFILRFSPLMKIGVTCLEELDLFDELSTQCARALINGLLDLIAADAEPDDAKVIRETLKKISSSGMSPAALWARLKLLCSNLPGDFFASPIPNPAPRPSYAEDESSDSEEEPVPQRASQRVKTRGSAIKTPVEEDELDYGNGVTHALQLLPCIIALCECALQGPSVRAEIGAGTDDARGENREYFASVRKENERWAKERADLGLGEGKGEDEGKGEGKNGKAKEKDTEKDQAYRTALAVHKSKLAALENEHLLELQGAAPRFGPLGRDSQGRVYYVASALRRKHKRANAKVPDEEDRVGLRKWDWFLAAWGRGGLASASSKADRDEKADCWWGFADPAEIRQLAKWLAAVEGVDGKDSLVEGPGGVRMKGEDVKKFEEESIFEAKFAFGQGPSTPTQAKALVKGLNEYADLLEWRIGGEAQH